MLTRYLIVRPDASWIQGDITAPNPVEAVALFEERLRAPSDAHHHWHVYEAPLPFPLTQSAWSGGDPVLLGMLAEIAPTATVSPQRNIGDRSLTHLGMDQKTIRITAGEALSVFNPRLHAAPRTRVRLLQMDLEIEMARAFEEREPPRGFVEAVRVTMTMLAGEVGIDLVWVSLDTFEGTLPHGREVVSGPAERLPLLDSMLVDAYVHAVRGYHIGLPMTLQSAAAFR